MKRKHGLDRAITPISRQELNALPTAGLLARLKRLRWCEDSREQSDLSDEEVASASHLILFKTDPAWRIAYADLKALLAAREHVTDKP